MNWKKEVVLAFVFLKIEKDMEFSYVYNSAMKLGQTYLVISTIIVTSIFSHSTTVMAQTNINIQEIIKNSDRYDAENITQVQQLRDISPGDWSYEAIRNLTQRFGCIKGFPDRVFQGDRFLTRDQFAAGLNSCLSNIERLMTSSKSLSTEANLEDIRLSQWDTKIAQKLAAMNSVVEERETKITNLENSQFSTTSKLIGEVVFGLGSIVAGSKDNGESNIDRVPFLGEQVTLELATSFTGQDELSIELEAANLPNLADASNTFQGELSFSGSNDNNLELNLMAYTFSVADDLEIIIGTTGLAADDIAESINFFASDNGGSGSISNFANLNPIYETSEDAGLGIIYELGEKIEFNAGYLASPANEPTENGGIFNAPYGAIAQAIISPSDRFNLAFTYIHSRNQSDTDTGSDLANVQSYTEDEFGEEVPTVSDSYGAEFDYELTDFLVLGGWGGLSKVTTLSSLDGQIDRGTQDVWNWAITLACPDLGKEGNLAGIVIGAEPWVTDSTIDSLGKDQSMSLHLEAFYQYRFFDRLAITPGIIWITAPENSDRENDLVIGTIRTTFSF